MRAMNITDGQKLALVKLCGKVTSKSIGRHYILSKLTGRKIEHTSDLQLNEWRKIRDEAYPNWRNDDWYVSDKFISKLHILYDEFETEVVGQGKLF